MNLLENKCVESLAGLYRDVADQRGVLGVIEIADNHVSESRKLQTVNTTFPAMLIDAKDLRRG